LEAEPRAQDTLNPYITNRPISDPSAFFGRKELLSWVQERMVKGDRILLLHGVRRIGKTSFLLQAPHQISAGYLALRLDLHKIAHLASIETTSAEGQEASFAWAFCQSVARQVTAAHTLPLSDPQHSGFVRDPRYALREFLTDLRRVLGNNILLLMLDDLDALPAGGAEQQFISDLIEQALERWRGLRFLITARSLAGLPTERGWAQQVPVQRLGPLNSTEALDLLKSPATGRLAYDPAAVRRAAELASGHPYYLQLLGYTLFNRCLPSGEVSLPDISAALEELLPLPFDEFDEWWQSSTPPEKVVLALLAELKGQGGVFTFYEVHKALTRQGVRIKHEIVEQALQSLAAREILEHLGAISYRARIELFRAWLPHHANLQEAFKAARWRVRRQPVPQVAQEIATEFTASKWLTWAIVTAAILVILFLIFRVPEAAKPQPTPPPTSSSLATLTPPPSASAAIGPTRTTPPTTPTSEAIARATPPSPTVAALPATPDLPHKGRLLYMRKEKAQAPWQLYLMDADGTNPRAVTNDRLDAAYPAWSPNGLSLAFVSERDGNKEIYTMNLDGDGLTNLTRHLADDWTPTWSPDGQWIAFASFRDENWELYAVNTDGTDLIRLTENENSDLSPAWSPDGKMLAFASKRSGDWDIYLMPWRGAAVTRLTRGPGSNLSPAWSPDGQWIAFESTRDGDAEIYLMRADGSEQRNLTNWPYADEHGPVWSSDGQWIAFYSNRDGNWDIYVMDREGKNLTNLTDDEVNNQSPAWSP
jgi:hypothetical protein